jgi:hypothetical protein
MCELVAYEMCEQLHPYQADFLVSYDLRPSPLTYNLEVRPVASRVCVMVVEDDFHGRVVRRSIRINEDSNKIVANAKTTTPSASPAAVREDT